ncbi:MAG: hypothetical protein VW338_05390 [Rhodospirillaceae bacterium]
MIATRARTLPMLIALLAALGLAGCAQPKKVWQKPGLTEEQWVIDSANCRSRAQDLAERDYAGQPGADPAGVDNANSYNALMRNYGAKRNQESLYRRCLESKGYRLIDQVPATKA